jgi:hemoglobin
MSERTMVYEAVGGSATFERLVKGLYSEVANDPVLRPLYPADLTSSQRYLTLFLVQYFSGPGTYSEERGHPRLRMRHMHLRIGSTERDAWLAHMSAALDTLDLPEAAREEFRRYFDDAATFLMNHAA